MGQDQMTGIFIRIGDQVTDTHRETTMREHREETAVHTPRKEVTGEPALLPPGTQTSILGVGKK